MTNNDIRTDEVQIDLVKLAKELLRRAVFIILAAVIFAGAAFVISREEYTPVYSTSALMYVNYPHALVEGEEEGQTATFDVDDMSAARTLVGTYMVILKSRGVLEEVIDQEDLSYDYQKLSSMVSCASVSSTEFFSITVTGEKKEETQRIANALADILPEKIAAVVEGSDVRVVDYAGEAIEVSQKPGTSRNKIILGALAGAVLAAAVVTVLYLFSDKIHDEDYLAQAYPGIPLLAVVPDKMDAGGKDRGDYYGGRLSVPPAPPTVKKARPAPSRPARPAGGGKAAPDKKRTQPAPGKKARPARPEGEKASRPAPGAGGERQPKPAEGETPSQPVPPAEEAATPLVTDAEKKGEGKSNG